MEESLRYVHPAPLSRAEGEALLRSAEAPVVTHTPVCLAFPEPDWRWVQNACLRLTDSPDPGLRGIAATCLGHLARLHRKIDLAAVVPVLERLAADPAVSGEAEDALDDIRTFVQQPHA